MSLAHPGHPLGHTIAVVDKSGKVVSTVSFVEYDGRDILSNIANWNRAGIYLAPSIRLEMPTVSARPNSWRKRMPKSRRRRRSGLCEPST